MKVQPSRTYIALSLLLMAGVALSVVRIVSAVTPNPGHPWSEVGDGVFAVSGPTAMHTFAFPNADATVLTTNALVTAAQGGTGNGFFAVSGPATSTKTFTFPNASATVLTTNAAVTIAQGGTGQTTSTAAFDALSPITTRGDLVVQGASSAGRLAVGGNNTVLRSNGTDPAWGSLNLATDVTGTLSVANGGTGLSSGTSGGVPYFSGTGSIASSALLADNQLVIGGGAGQPPNTLGSVGTTTTVLHGNASGMPSFGAVSLTADVSGTLPKANGGTGTANTGYVFKGMTVFTSGTAATYTVPSGVTAINVCVTGSGGGGGCSDGSANNAGAAGGGGAGATTCKFITSPAASYIYTVGAAPTACTAGNNNGNDGNASCFKASATPCTTSIIQADGGSGGSHSNTAATSVRVQLGGAGGTVTTAGDVSMPGQAGAVGNRSSGTNACGGNGGSSYYGGGGNGGGGADCGTSSAGGTGGAYGAGGGGAASIGNSDRQGGVGGSGAIVIYEYY